MRKPAAEERAKHPRVAEGGGVLLSIIKSLPAPVGGWNARDPLAAMAAIDAVKLENWFPRVADCAIREGCEEHATGFGERPATLAVYNALSGTNKLFAATSTGIYDATSAGAIGAAALARTNGYHVWVQMGTSAGNFLYMVNGVDKPAFYDGAAWVAVDGASTPALTGVTTTSLVSCNVYKRRLFFLETGKLNFWYLAIDSIGGALTEFQLGPLCAKGGYAMAMATWSLDGGNGPDDFAAFVTSEGEVIVFTGTNPADSAAWSLVGVFYVGKPLGRKCFKKYGGDLVLITELGVVPMSKVLVSKEPLKTALTNKIEGAFIDAARVYGANQGWTSEILPGRGAFIFNVPTSGGGATAEQFVMNTTTKAWCKFTGWNASDFVTFNGELYFADSTKVSKAWTGRSDYDANIVAAAQTAFNNFKDGRDKDWKMFRPMLRVNGAINFSIGMAIDFDPSPTLTPASYSVISAALWDQALWDQAYWAAGLEVVRDWRTPGVKVGQWGAGLLTIQTNELEIQWAANDYLYETGSVVT